MNKRGMKLLGRAVFDVQDVLGSRNNVKARRLRKGGVIYAHCEIEQQQHAPTLSPPSSPTRSLTSSITSSTTAKSHPDCRILNLRLRADSLIHTHSNLSKVGLHVSNPTTYYEISRPSSLALHGSSWIVVYRSPPIKESVSPLYDESMIDLSSFITSTTSTTTERACSNNAKEEEEEGEEEELSKSPIMMTVYKVKWKKCKEIGSFETTIQSLIDAACNTGIGYHFTDDQSENNDEEEVSGGEVQHKTFQLRPTVKKGASRSDEITGNITVIKATVENSNDAWHRRSFKFLSNVDENDDGNTEGESTYELNDGVDTHQQQQPSSIPRPKFSDYVRAGTVDIDFCVAIDFTSSNGDPRIPGSQHYSRDGMMNDYEEAIVAISDTIGKYSTDQLYPVWGFGAKYGGKVRHIFQCGSESTVHDTEGILDAYRSVWETDLIMSGPTVLHSVLRAAAARSKKFYNSPATNMNMQYCVLLILTDGIVADLESTQELVRSYSNLQLPLSVIVIGIGRADFSQFHEWNKAPPDIRGRFVFVEFREYQFDTDTLSRKALLRVPHDIVDYYMSRNILP